MYEPTIDPSLLVGRDKAAGLHSEPLAVLKPPQVELRVEDLKITNYQCIGSYNWFEPTSGTPTILIPGKSKFTCKDRVNECFQDHRQSG